MIDDKIEQIKTIIEYHEKLHGKDGIVEYALVDDIMRKMSIYMMRRDQIEDIVTKLLKEKK